MELEQKLYEAAIQGSLPSLREILSEDKLILHRVGLHSSNAGSPLLAAASGGHLEFVTKLLELNPDLADATDSRRRSPLHLAAARGHLSVVNALASLYPEMCRAQDSEGRIPLHVAAVKGKVEVVEALVQANPRTVGAKVEGSETILHLCAKNGQWETLKVLLNRISSSEILNAKDGGYGNTVLHLAVADKQYEIIEQLLESNKVDINLTNANGYTPLDTLSQYETESEDIGDILLEFGAKEGKNLVKGEWLREKRAALMVVASLMATIAFQAGVSPPGGVWQDNSDGFDGHCAGETVMAYNYPDSFPYFLRANTTGFVTSLSVILLLTSGLPFRKRAFMWLLVVIMWLTITAMAFTYAFSITVVTPKKDRKSLSYTIVVAVIVWCSVMAVLLLVHTVRLGAAMVNEQRIKYMATHSHRIFGCRGSSRRRRQPNGAGGVLDKI